VAEARRWLLAEASVGQAGGAGITGDPDGIAEPVLALAPAADVSGGGETGGTGDPGGGDPPPVGPRLTVVDHGQSANATDGALAYDGEAGSLWVASGGRAPRSGSVWFDLGAGNEAAAARWRFGRNGFADSYKIQVSDDGAAWQTVASRRGSGDGRWMTMALAAPGRYVRFLFANPRDDRYLGYLSEVELYGAHDASGGSGSGGGNGDAVRGDRAPRRR
jgi:hypothetical protein